MTQSKRVLAVAGLIVASTGLAYAPTHGVANAAVRPTSVQAQTAADIDTRGYFTAANGWHIPVQSSNPVRRNAARRGIGSHAVSSGAVASNAVSPNAGPIGNGTIPNVRANQDFGAFVPHQTPSIAEDPINIIHLTIGAEDARLGPAISVPGRFPNSGQQPENAKPYAQSGFYNSLDSGKTFTDGLVQGIANDYQTLYNSLLTDGSDYVHGHYSESVLPRLAYDKFEDLFYVSEGTVPAVVSHDNRAGLNDVLVSRSSVIQNSGNPTVTGNPYGNCAVPSPALACSFDNPFAYNRYTTPSVSNFVIGSGRYFDNVQLPPVSPAQADGETLLTTGVPYVVDSNNGSATAPTGGFRIDSPNIAVDTRPNVFNNNGGIAGDQLGSQTIYVTWTREYFNGPRFGAADIYFSTSSDGGNTFTAPQRIVVNAAGLCTNTAVPADPAGTCNENAGPYPVVDYQGVLHIVFENFNATRTVPVPPNSPYDTSGTGAGTLNHQLLQVTCTNAPACTTFDGGSFVASVVDAPGAFGGLGVNPDHGAIFATSSFPSAATNPLTRGFDVVWADARDTFNTTGSCPVHVVGTAGRGTPGCPFQTDFGPSGGTRIWEFSAGPNLPVITPPYGPLDVGNAPWGNKVASPAPQPAGVPVPADGDELFPSITTAYNPTVGQNTYVTFYVRTDDPAGAADPYGLGVGNSVLDYVATRNTFNLTGQPLNGAPAQTMLANGTTMPLPLVNQGILLTHYTQSVADYGGVHSAWVDTRGSIYNFYLNGAEDIVASYMR